MTEGMKTLIYAGLAVFIGLVAYATKPKPAGLKPSETLGKPLFEGFVDPLTARTLEIVNFDASDSKLTSFKVSQNKDGTWSIPSHSDYPADAENQLRDAATALVGLKPLGIASEVAEDHASFGVLAPDKDKTKAGEQGVGLLVKMQDESGKGAGAAGHRQDRQESGRPAIRADSHSGCRVRRQDRSEEVHHQVWRLDRKGSVEAERV